MKQTTSISRKLLLCMALAGFTVVGLGVTVGSPRLAQAEAEGSYVGDKGSGQEKMEQTEKKVEAENAKEATEERAEKKTEKQEEKMEKAATQPMK